MDLRHLRYFVAVAEEGSMTRAAERLGIQQPPLGQQIRNLEDELGVQLFERRPRQIALSPTGTFFVEEARAVLRHAAEAAQRVRRFDRGEIGHLNIGLTSSASLHPLTPKILRGFHDTYPLAEVSVRESETYELILALREGRIDAAFLHISTDRYPDLQSHVLTREKMMAVVPIDHPLTRTKKPLDWPRLLEEDFVIYRRTDGPGIFDGILDAVAAFGGRMKIVGEVSRLIGAINLVAAGRGISIVPATMRALHPETVAYLPLAAGALQPLPFYMAHKKQLDLAIVANFVAKTQAISAQAG
ncbi:MAG TPA: LysR family transcriptional regulator [Beijerinckiaceae bacterium]|jgi:DNA-binding transcriptional LysR family regulator|nr:LysR family transcriptional regulator [Beijerinckiaceae bacterium]